MRGWLLDTNVVSEPGRKRPDARVMNWLNRLPAERTFISVLTLGEMDKGVELLPPGPRRSQVTAYRDQAEADYAGRILAIDNEIVRLWGALSGRYTARFGGQSPVIDALLAATAQTHRLHLATRNVRDARPLGGSVFDPWRDDPAQFPLTR